MASPARSRASSLIKLLERHPHLGAFAGFSILTLLFFSRSLGGDFMFRDAFHEYYAIKQLWGWTLDGHLALWNPGTCLGMSLAGAVYPGLWYPLNWLLFPLLHLPADYAMMAYTLLHFVLAGTAMVFMLSEIGVGRHGAWAGAVAYAFSGYLVSQHYAMNLLGGMALMPAAAGMLVKARADGIKWCLLAGVVTGLIFLAGDPQVFALTIGVAVLMMLTFRPAGGKKDREMGAVRLAAGALIYVGVALASACAELLPSLTVMAESARAGGIDFASATCWSTHPLRILEFFLSRPFGDAWPLDRYWGGFMGERCFPLPLVMSPYMGMWTLLACAAAWRRFRDARVMLFTALLVFFLALAMGRYLPLYKLLYSTLPGFDAFRYPEKYLFMATFCLAALAGLGTDRMVSSAPADTGGMGQTWDLRSNARALAGPAAAVALAAAVGLAGRVYREEICSLLMPLIRESMAMVTPQEAADDVITALVWSCIFAGLSLLAAQALHRSRARMIAYAPVVVLFLDLFGANSGLAPAAPGLYRMTSRFAEIILARENRPTCASGQGRAVQVAPPCCAHVSYEPCAGPGSFRIFRDNRIQAPEGLTYEQMRRWECDTLKPNLGMIEGFEYFGGLNVAEPKRFERMMAGVVTFDRLPVFNVKYAIIPEAEAASLGPEARPLAHFEGAALVEFKDVFPRTYWIRGFKMEMDLLGAEAMFGSNDFTRMAIISLDPEYIPRIGIIWPWMSASVPGRETDQIIPARVKSYFPDDVEIEVKAPEQGWLVLNDLFYPGWTARVDGKRVEIYVANGLARAVRMGPGRHTVVFRYRPRGLWEGLALTAACWIAGLVVLSVIVIKRRR